MSKEIATLCAKNKEGRVVKSAITISNFKKLKALADEFDIQVVKTHQGTFSYRQYCKLFESYSFKNKKCDDKVCCQAITEEGQRCSRSASRFATVDLTESQLTPKIPLFIKRRLGVKKVEELKLIGFGNTCCFYCWQHASMYMAEGLTYLTNLSYYLTHPEDILIIFFEKVDISKFLRIITYRIDVDQLRTPDEIIKNAYKLSADLTGKFSLYYWGIFMLTFMYDTIKPHILKILGGSEKEKTQLVKDMAEVAAETLLKMNE